jgi:hypothetical protein
MGTEVLVPFFVFMMPVMIVFIIKYFRFREKELALRERQEQKLLGPGDREREDKERKQLEARIQNLESIVCSVDFELNQRISRLLDQVPGPGQGQAQGLAAGPPPAAGQLPAHGPGPAQAGGATLRAPAGPLLAGQTVAGRYTVERELGRGGMGAVYLAQDAKLGERVALKTLSTALAADVPALLTSIRREVQAARRSPTPTWCASTTCTRTAPWSACPWSTSRARPFLPRCGGAGPCRCARPWRSSPPCPPGSARPTPWASSTGT